MKKIEIDDELYHFIASRTQSIGESASDILRRLLRLPSSPQPFALVQQNLTPSTPVSTSQQAVEETVIKPHQKSKAKVKKNEHSEQIVSQIEAVLNAEAFTQEKKAVAKFITLLSALYQADSERFAVATEQVTGNERTYFAKDEASLLRHGSGVKAKQIPASPFWVITNNNTHRKGLIVTNVMVAMGLPKALIKRVSVHFA